VGLVVLAYTHQDLTRKTFQVKQKQLFWLYVILILAAISLPWHYHWTDLPVTYYLLFTTVSVICIWQDYLIFGLFQRYLQQELSFKWRIVFYRFCLYRDIFFIFQQIGSFCSFLCGRCMTRRKRIMRHSAQRRDGDHDDVLYQHFLVDIVSEIL